MKWALSKLFEAREEIYHSLMQWDLFIKYASHGYPTKESLLTVLEELKQSNFMITYQQALDILESEVEIEERIKIPNPNAYKNFIQKSYPDSEDQWKVKEFSEKYSYRKFEFSW